MAFPGRWTEDHACKVPRELPRWPGSQCELLFLPCLGNTLSP